MIASLEYAFLRNPEPVVFVVDDDAAVRKSLEMLIGQAGWRSESFATAQAFLDRPHLSGPGCLVLEMTLPDLTGLDVQKITSGNQPNVPIVFITNCGDIDMTVRAMKGGAFDFLAKPIRPEITINAIRRAIARSQYAISCAEETRELRDRYSSLTLRERDVVSLVVTGLLNKQVAEKLGVSEITVKVHRASAMRKLKVESLAGLVKLEARLSPG